MQRPKNISTALLQKLLLGASAIILTSSVSFAGGMPEGYAEPEPRAEPTPAPIFKPAPQPKPVTRLKSAAEPTPVVMQSSYPKYQLGAYGGLQGNLDGSASGNVNNQLYSFDTDWEPNIDDLDFYAGLRATRWDSASGGWQLDFNEAVSNAQLSDLVNTPFSFMDFHSLNITTISRIFRLDDFESAPSLKPYFGLGIGVAFADVVYRAQPAGATAAIYTKETELTGPAYSAQLGFEFDMSEKIIGFAEATIKRVDLDVDVTSANIDATLHPYALNLGVAYRF